MDDFGNIVYVLAAVGWFVWNTYKKSQKGDGKEGQPVSKKKREGQSFDREQPARSLEDIIMEQLEGKKRPEPVPVTKSSNNQDKFLSMDLTHSHLSESYKMSDGEMKSHRVQRQVPKLKVEELEEETLMERVVPSGFSLQQAIVLNAILERPYN